MEAFTLTKMNEGREFNITVIPWSESTLRVSVDSKGLTESYNYDIEKGKIERCRMRMKVPVEKADTIPMAEVERMVIGALVNMTLEDMP